MLGLTVDFGALLIGAESERLQRKSKTKFNRAKLLKVCNITLNKATTLLVTENCKGCVKMKKWLLIVFALLLAVWISGCSGSDEESQADEAVGERNSKSSLAEGGTQSEEIAKEEVIQSENLAEEVAKEPLDKKTSSPADRMVIYIANLSIRVDSYQDTLKLVQQQLTSFNGYIVESNSYSTAENDSLEGTITVRIPQDKFDSFLLFVEKEVQKL
jgi:hypothetical protein